MSIEGLQPVYGVGPVATPQPVQPARGDPVTMQDQNFVQPVEISAKTGASGSGGATTGSDAESRRDRPLQEARQKSDPGYREPTLPRLSAEALATALMTSEPDKAIVPRVLPVEVAVEPEPGS